MAHTIGLDYGSNSVRCVIVDVSNGNEVGTAVFHYPTGNAGIIINSKNAQGDSKYIKINRYSSSLVPRINSLLLSKVFWISSVSG